MELESKLNEAERELETGGMLCEILKGILFVLSVMIVPSLGRRRLESNISWCKMASSVL